MSENNAVDDLLQLKATLEHKEQVILALTQRLGETAEHLDRLQRMGMDKIRPGSGGGGGSIPRELLESQEKLAERMNGFVDRWDEYQTFDRLLKMEETIEEILSSVRSSGGRGIASGAPRSESRSELRQEARAVPSQEQPAEQAVSPWDALKAKLMQQDGGASTEKTTGAGAVAVEQKPVEQIVSERIEAGPVNSTDSEIEFELIEPPPPPEPVDFNASTQTMRDGLDRRDAYIAFLINRLKHVERRRFEPVNWDVVAQAPAELVQHVKELESTLQDQLKKFEIAQSLERAALTRERSRLQQVKQHLENEILSLGAANAGAARKERDPNKAAAEESRLARLLGKRK